MPKLLGYRNRNEYRSAAFITKRSRIVFPLKARDRSDGLLGISFKFSSSTSACPLRQVTTRSS